MSSDSEHNRFSVLTVMEGSDVLYSPTCVEVLQSVVLPWSYLCVCVCVTYAGVRKMEKEKERD